MYVVTLHMLSDGCQNLCVLIIPVTFLAIHTKCNNMNYIHKLLVFENTKVSKIQIQSQGLNTFEDFSVGNWYKRVVWSVGVACQNAREWRFYTHLKIVPVNFGAVTQQNEGDWYRQKREGGVIYLNSCQVLRSIIVHRTKPGFIESVLYCGGWGQPTRIEYLENKFFSIFFEGRCSGKICEKVVQSKKSSDLLIYIFQEHLKNEEWR